MRFALLLEIYRRRAGLSRRELSERSGVSVNVIRNLEHDAYVGVFENLIALALALELHPVDLLEFDD